MIFIFPRIITGFEYSPVPERSTGWYAYQVSILFSAAA
jgi:hypothetical protein